MGAAMMGGNVQSMEKQPMSADANKKLIQAIFAAAGNPDRQSGR